MHEIGVSHQMVEDREERSVQWQRPKGRLLGTATKEIFNNHRNGHVELE